MTIKKTKLISFIFLALIVSGTIFFVYFISGSKVETYYYKPNLSFWEIKSIDTMKYSRDLSRKELNNPGFDAIIDSQTKNIAGAGATHISIATPYDEEFLPILKRWVMSARKHKLKVWFRGNWSGWEKWFDYPSIERAEHIEKTKNFILANPDLFEDGDIFSSCPECENGGPGDPRKTGDIEGYRKFIIEEYREAKSAFKKIDKEVDANFFSMNGDVARLIMDKKTTTDLDGIVAIDHYVDTPQRLKKDIKELAETSGGKIVLGEFGAPIPDIHGKMNDEEQAKWLESSLQELAEMNELLGINYWVNVGGSTQLWTEKGIARPAAHAISKYYKSGTVCGVIEDEAGDPVWMAEISSADEVAFSDKSGYFEMLLLGDSKPIIVVSASGFNNQEAEISLNNCQNRIILIKKNEDSLFKIKKFFRGSLGY